MITNEMMNYKNELFEMSLINDKMKVRDSRHLAKAMRKKKGKQLFGHPDEPCNKSGLIHVEPALASLLNFPGRFQFFIHNYYVLFETGWQSADNTAGMSNDVRRQHLLEKDLRAHANPFSMWDNQHHERSFNPKRSLIKTESLSFYR